MGRRIFTSVFNSKGSEFNDLFLPGRMAYAIDLEDDDEDDIPTTVIRSKADLQGIEVRILILDSYDTTKYKQIIVEELITYVFTYY